MFKAVSLSRTRDALKTHPFFNLLYPVAKVKIAQAQLINKSIALFLNMNM